LLPRHHLVWLDRLVWGDFSGRLDKPTRAIVRAWFDRDLPAVARRHAEDDPENAVPLGIPSTPREGRLRIAFNVPQSRVRKTEPPLALCRVISSAPPAWQAALTELNTSFRVARIGVRVYGSLAWQHITQEDHVTERSDVDLLLKPEDRPQLELALALLQDWEVQTGLRADGEFLLPDGAAVAWRELLHARGRVLVKSSRSLTLRTVSELLGALHVKPTA